MPTDCKRQGLYSCLKQLKNGEKTDGDIFEHDYSSRIHDGIFKSGEFYNEQAGPVIE